MIVIRMLGGLGNQLFIYAFGRALQTNHNQEVYFDNFSGFFKDPYNRKFELYNFNTIIHKASPYTSLYFPIRNRWNLLSKYLYPHSVYIEENEIFSIDYLAGKAKSYKTIFLQGYFQKLRYFDNIIEKLREEITLNKSLSIAANQYLREINKNNSIAIHIRRREIKEQVPLHYYLENVKYIEAIINKPKFYIFSDDIKWCKEILEYKSNIQFIEGTDDHIEDFWLMKNCRHFIISNSTFSMWAALLSDYDNKLIIEYKS